MRKGPKRRKLNKKQKKIIGEIFESYLFWKKEKENLKKLFKKAQELEIPITQLGKAIGINKVAVWRRYKRSKK